MPRWDSYRLETRVDTGSPGDPPLHQPLGEFLASEERFAQLDEGAHEIQTHFPRARRVKDEGCHQGPVPGEGERYRRGKPQPPEVAAICDYLVALGAAELEDKIGAKKRRALRLTCSFIRLVGTP